MNSTFSMLVVKVPFVFLFMLSAQVALGFSVRLDGAVSQDSVRSVMSSINKHMEAGETEMTLRLDSEGGDIPAAVSLANFLRDKSAQGLSVTTYNRLKCNSACTIIFAAGQTRKATRAAEFYFHSVGVSGAGKDHDAVQFHWARVWSSQIAMVDSRLGQELEDDDILVGESSERIYKGGRLFDDGYTYVTELN